MFSRNKIFAVLLLATMIRCFLAFSIDLGNDEVYYLTYARHLQWNYFDHPPMVALLIRLSTFNMQFTSEFFIRLGPIVLAAINTYLVFTIGKKLKNEQAGLLAALLYTASVYSSIISGLFIMPDSPQLFFWILSLWILIKVVDENSTITTVNANLLFFGLVAGLCIMSKVHGVFLWFGFIMYVLWYKRILLKNPFFYCALLLTLVVVSPILFWNIANDFITYQFHSDRVVINQGVNFNSFFRELVGGILYNNPINYFLVILGLISFFKKKNQISTPFTRLLFLLSLPLIVVLLMISVFRDTLPHWSGPAYVTLMILVSCFLADEENKNFSFRWAKWANFLVILIAGIGVWVINFYPGTLGSNDVKFLGKKDVTLDMYDWSYFKDNFEDLLHKNNIMGIANTRFVVNNKWFPGAHIDNYIAEPLNLQFVAIGELNDIHTYYWLNQYRPKLKEGDDAYFVTFSNYFKNPHELYGGLFEKINAPVIIEQVRGGKPVRNMYVYLMRNYKGSK
ncbi:glycosyltransferase family 39 protein [Flavobacterium sp. UMI-01]|uniref:ArnT family glycosyltransferase n=1 Tax=Flavobacterium sp. UMI-01 TaxID=1441053 RepID=UPI001C7CB996|nr:glycosyltransferase family 39 protein [Flavobacterium sp. UMI-01]GIZ10407.1 hypothetical protein FUMI01_31310 [Flavobacterium sp. UMI-01]